MKQYTTPEQTAKLIELGVEKPKTIVDKYYDFDAEDYKEVKHYSIGELISFIPSVADWDGQQWRFCMECHISGGWTCFYINASKQWWTYDKDNAYIGIYNEELIDALFSYIIILKEKRVI